MVVCPQHAPAPRGHALEVGGRRPAAPAVRVPTVPAEPRRWIGQSAVCGADTRHPLLDARRVGQVHLASRDRAAGQVQVRVGQSGECHLVRPQRDALSEWVRACLERDLGTCECDPTVADPDGLDPAEAAVPGERRDPTGDQAVEGHRVRVAGRPGVKPARRGRAPRRSRGRVPPAP